MTEKSHVTIPFVMTYSKQLFVVVNNLLIVTHPTTLDFSIEFHITFRTNVYFFFPNGRDPT